MRVSEFDYALPAELIAQHPAPERTASRLLHLDAASGRIEDLAFTDLPALVGKRDALVLNDTRVIKARLAGKKASGGKIELFVERVLGARDALALIRSSHAPRAGNELIVGDGARVTVIGREEDLYRVRFAQDVAQVLERCGAVPLPPYIRHAPDAADAKRYQTVYAERPGAVAAPTAGLHFDRPMLQRLQRRGASIASLTLHVGAGTFQPVRVEDIELHRMHKEHYEVPRATMDAIAGRRVLAVGTTSLRALESAALGGQLRGETDLFVRPGFQFLLVDRLLTNFHLPKSSLLMLVAAFAGLDTIRRAYAHAIEQRYRFFSYGDAMLIERAR
ncbi:MAG: tRNA preQ1(34) S-adenosylmethionine ribosyltransferase-isomerase QueA [Betaproteobacteria bacterium]|nr:tRNA preQ1(34) S-adenosylmethionine ribosyltransferase-isomerase QueA [Betaproteobacteria bacterium]MDH5210359.1 tRNA preQ1(34) S-adenosylmethionine ribosyltransferase-isomerase QueA [Betaproteobacteria bacterium]